MSPLLFRRLSDESLGSRLASGEAAAFDELYRRYVHRLAAYGAHLLGDRAAGDDVAQSALLKAYAALRDGRVPDRMRPWLFRIAHNAAIDLLARRRELPAGDLPDRPAEDPREAGALVTALASLPDRQRRVYALRELHGLRIDETAAELGLSAAQVEQALFAARNRLAELLVFGERLSCVAVQRLAAGPLDGAERRALRTHLHSCAACRAAVGRRASPFLLPLAPLEWLRGLLPLGGAPVAAKVGAAVATATIAAGVPVAVHETRHAARPRPPRVVHAAPRPRAVVRATVPVVGRDQRVMDTAPVAAPARAVSQPTPRHDDRRGEGERAPVESNDGGSAPTGVFESRARDGGDSGSDGGRSGPDGGSRSDGGGSGDSGSD